MPHILSSSSLDLLFWQEMNGRAIPKVTNNDSTLTGGTSTTITFNARELGEENGLGTGAIMFVNLLQIVNDPLLDNIEVTLNFLPPTKKLTFTKTARTSTIVLPSVFLPMTKVDVKLTARSGVDSGFTLTSILDIMSKEDASEYALLGQNLHDQILEIQKKKTQAAGLIPRVSGK